MGAKLAVEHQIVTMEINSGNPDNPGSFSEIEIGYCKVEKHRTFARLHL